MAPINYKKASTYYLFGTLFNKGIAFLTVPIFTRILTVKDYGIVTTYNSWVAIASMMIGCALHMGIRAAFIDYKENMREIMSVTATYTVFSGLVTGTVTVLLSSRMAMGLNRTLIWCCLIQATAIALLEDYSMYLMMQYRYRFRTVLMVLPNCIAILISVWVIRYAANGDLYLGRIVPTAVVTAVFGGFVLMLIYTGSRQFINRKYLKYCLTIALPLVLHGLALNILSQSDRIMITWLADSSQTGIYSLVYNFGTLATVITTAIEGVWVPWFTGKLKERKISDINKLVVDYVNFITYAMVALVLCGPEILKLLASREYWAGVTIIPPIVLSNYVIFIYTLYVNIEHYHKKTLIITRNTVIAALLNLVLNYFLIPSYGYVAAAYTTLISYFAAFILHAAYAKNLEKELYPIRIFARPLIHIVGAAILFYISLNIAWLRWGAITLYLAAMLFKDRRRIHELLANNMRDS